LCPFWEGELGPHLTQCDLVYLPSKWHLDSSSGLATKDIGRKLGEGYAPFFEGGRWLPIYHTVAWAQSYIHTKWHFDPSSRLAITHGSKSVVCCAPFFWGGGWSWVLI